MWMCYIEHDGWQLLGGLDEHKDCFGDVLYNHMIRMGWIKRIEDYKCKGNSSEVSVIGKDKTFKWVYVPETDDE